MITIHDLRAWKTEGNAVDHAHRLRLPHRADPRRRRRARAAGRRLRRAQRPRAIANELPVTMEEMLHHTRAVARGVERAMVVGDMPFMSFQASTDDGIRNAGRLIKEGGAHAVKIEGPQYELIHRLVDVGIPVMAHIGLTPAVGLRARRLQGAGARRGGPHGARPGPQSREGRRVLDRAGGDAGRARRRHHARAADPHDRDRRGRTTPTPRCS